MSQTAGHSVGKRGRGSVECREWNCGRTHGPSGLSTRGISSFEPQTAHFLTLLLAEVTESGMVPAQARRVSKRETLFQLVFSGFHKPHASPSWLLRTVFGCRYLSRFNTRCTFVLFYTASALGTRIVSRLVNLGRRQEIIVASRPQNIIHPSRKLSPN